MNNFILYKVKKSKLVNFIYFYLNFFTNLFINNYLCKNTKFRTIQIIIISMNATIIISNKFYRFSFTFFQNFIQFIMIKFYNQSMSIIHKFN
jgi:hypothetical protein